MYVQVYLLSFIYLQILYFKLIIKEVFKIIGHSIILNVFCTKYVNPATY